MSVQMSTNNAIYYQNLEHIDSLVDDRIMTEDLVKNAMIDYLKRHFDDKTYFHKQDEVNNRNELLRKAIQGRKIRIIEALNTFYYKILLSQIPEKAAHLNIEGCVPQLDSQTQCLLNKINAENCPPLDENSLKVLQSIMPDVNKTVLSQIKKIENIEISGPIGPIKIRLYFPHTTSTEALLPVFIFFHGGGWALGSLDEYDYFCQQLCHQTPCIVASVDYHLAPQHKFPKPLEDCYTATKWISEQVQQFGGNPKRLAIGGDSAGGNLAAAVTLMAREKNTPQIHHQVLIFPVLDNQFNTPSYQQFASGYYLSRETMQFFWRTYLRQSEDGSSPYASPLKAQTLSNLPPASIVLANFDPLRDEALAYAYRLHKDNVPVKVTSYRTIHGFINFEKELGVADQAIQEIAKDLHRALY